MAGGLDRLYPAANLELFKLVCNSGALVSEVAPGVSPSRWRFLQRNRLIAALGKATVVVEAGYRSGSINTAGHANELGRPVGAIPGPVDSVRSAGCHRLIREQRAELIATPDQLAELMGLQTEQIAGQQFKTTEQIRVLDALYGKVLSSVQAANLAGLTLSETELTLNQLSKLGLVRQISNGWQKL
jgi:DNA processing protein